MRSDAKTGDVKWQFQTGFDANQPAASYEMEGQQYVAVITRAAYGRSS